MKKNKVNNYVQLFLRPFSFSCVTKATDMSVAIVTQNDGWTTKSWVVT